MTYLSADTPAMIDATLKREISRNMEIMHQDWERQQEAARQKVEREAPALEALGFQPEEFHPMEWPGAHAQAFADMAREWEAPIFAHTARKREQLADAFASLFTLAEEVSA